MRIVGTNRREQSPQRAILVLPWPSSRPPLHFAECDDYACRVDVLWARPDLRQVHRERLVECSIMIWRADTDPFARCMPPAFIMGVEKGLPQVHYLDAFIDACMDIEAVEDAYAGAI